MTVGRPPQWLFDEITNLPPEARGWALGFMLAGWLAGREDALTTSRAKGGMLALDEAPTPKE